MGLLLIGEGGWIIGTHMRNLCGLVTNRGGGMDYRNTYVAFMWVRWNVLKKLEVLLGSISAKFRNFLVQNLLHHHFSLFAKYLH